MTTAAASAHIPGRNECFRDLIERAAACTRCARMTGRRRVLGPANGALDARLLFVAEAPGRLGAERCGTPLAGDQTGRNFERLLAAAGLAREAVFVTNAVLCNPQTPGGTNDRPTSAELANCGGHLTDTIAVVDPDLVVALGVAALAALHRVHPHAVALRTHLARPQPWFGRWLAPLYHPSPRTRVFRSAAEQAGDLRRCLAAGGVAARLHDVSPGGAASHTDGPP